MLNMGVELINWVKDGKYRVKTLVLLNERSMLSSEIASKLSVNRASMSRILGKLKERNLVNSVSEKSRTVTYLITKEGKNLLRRV